MYALPIEDDSANQQFVMESVRYSSTKGWGAQHRREEVSLEDKIY